MAGRHAVVAGGGVGGLSAAVALHRRGWAVTVCERAPSLEPVGAGISLAPNALRALDAIGLGGAARAFAVVQGSGGIRRPDGAWLVRTDLRSMSERYGDPLVIAHRAELVSLLACELPDGRVRTGTEVLGVDPASGRVTTSAGELTADLVVAADGVRSAIRTAVFPQHPGPRYSGTTTWRLLASTPGGGFSPAETWGRGQIFGVVPLSGDRVYCFASALAPAGTVHADERAELLRRFADWHAPIGGLLRSVEPAEVLHNDVYWMADRLPAYHTGRVALLGDAAHAMTPNLGQGGCQAIEDAVVLAHEVGRAELPAALAAYTAARQPRTEMVVRRSYRVSRIVGSSAAPLVLARDTAMRLAGRLSPDLLVRQLAPEAGWTPPS